MPLSNRLSRRRYERLQRKRVGACLSRKPSINFALKIETPNSFDRRPALSGSSGGVALLAEEEPRIDEHINTDHLLPDLKRHTVSGGAITIAAQIAKFMLNFVSTVILARLLSPRDFGLVAMVTVVTGFLMVFRHAGLAIPTIQREQITQAQVSNLFWINLAVSGLCTLIVAAFVLMVYHDSRLVPITLVLSLTFLIGGFKVQHLALLRRQLRFRSLAVIDVGSMAMGISIGIIMAVMRFGAWSLVGLSLGTEVGSFILTGSLSRWRPGWPSRDSGVRPLLTFGADQTAGV